MALFIFLENTEIKVNFLNKTENVIQVRIFVIRTPSEVK